MGDAAADVVGAADASARTLSGLHVLIISWAGAPEQVHHLRDDVERFSSLLESVRTGGERRPDDPVLIREVALARRALESVETVLEDLGVVSDVRRRHRWVLRREVVARSQRGLQMSCHHMLSRLVMLNL